MKFVKLLAFLLIMLPFSGCKYAADYVDPEERYIITAIGFQKSNDGVLVLLEAPKENSSSNASVSVFSANGDSLSSAIRGASNKIPGELLFSQCPIILLDRGIQGEILDDIFDLCLSDYDISLSVQFVCCENPQKILSENIGHTSVGFTIHRAINYSNKDINLSEICRFAKIFNDNNKTGEFYIPFISSKNEIIDINGLQCYRKNRLYEFIDIGAVR